MFDQTFSYVLAIAALVIGVMLLTGHGSVFMKGGNTQARAQKYDEKKMEKFSGICLILIGIATGVDAFTESMAAKIAYVVILFVILAVFLFLSEQNVFKNNIGPISVIHKKPLCGYPKTILIVSGFAERFLF